MVRDLDGVADRCGLKTVAEAIGFTIYSARAKGDDRTEQLELVELLLKATDTPREDIREARDLLGRLGFGDDLTGLLTRLARKAKPKPAPYRLPGLGGPTFRERVAMRKAADERAAKQASQIDAVVPATAMRSKRKPQRQQAERASPKCAKVKAFAQNN
jgi:hypothetical protein